MERRGRYLLRLGVQYCTVYWYAAQGRRQYVSDEERASNRTRVLKYFLKGPGGRGRSSARRVQFSALQGGVRKRSSKHAWAVRACMAHPHLAADRWNGTSAPPGAGAELHGGPGGPRTTGAYQAHRYRKIQSDRIRPAAVLRSFVILRAAAMRPFVSP